MALELALDIWENNILNGRGTKKELASDLGLSIQQLKTLLNTGRVANGPGRPIVMTAEVKEVLLRLVETGMLHRDDQYVEQIKEILGVTISR